MGRSVDRGLCFFGLNVDPALIASVAGGALGIHGMRLDRVGVSGFRSFGGLGSLGWPLRCAQRPGKNGGGGESFQERFQVGFCFLAL